MVNTLAIVLLLMSPTWARMDTSDNQQVMTHPSLLERVDKLERIVLLQDTKLAHQDHLLVQQAETLAYQEKQLQLQSADLLDTKIELTTTKTELLTMKSEQSILNSELTKTKANLLTVETRCGDLDKGLSRQKTRLSQQSVKLSEQKRQLRHQYNIIKKLISTRFHSKDYVLSTDEQNSILLSTKGQVNTSPTHLSDNQSSFSPHNLTPRADDMGPLEAVVSQISQRVTEMSADIQTLKNSDSQQNQDIADAQTSTFIRWGSSQCDSSSHLVYSGVVGGSWKDHTGAATNPLCLTMSPVLSDHVDSYYKAFLYGTEYQTGDSHNENDPVCAVCRSKFSTTVMIPGTNRCTAGWNVIYSGLLMAGDYNHPAATDYICVDSQMEALPHTSANDDGQFLTYTTTRCGSLPCLPYTNDKTVTCVVCGK